jgi:Transposase DDE domain
LPALVSALLSMRASSQQAMLDGFFSALGDAPAVSDRAFAKARSHLHMPALTWLNDWLIQRCEAARLISRWHGLRVVVGDGSVLMPAVRRCPRTRNLAAPEQRLFALFLPGIELTLHASVHSASESERAMLVQALDKLGPDDVLVLDRGYPASWLVNLLIERGIKFVIRCDFDGAGWTGVREFKRSGKKQSSVQLSAPSATEAEDWQCSRNAPTVRLVRQIAPGGGVRVLMTNIDEHAVPHEAFGDLYHQRWRIEEAFKRLKLRMGLEAVSGLSQHALIIDVAAKILADNIAALLCHGAAAEHDLGARQRKCNRSFAAKVIQRALPPILLGIGNTLHAIGDLMRRLARATQRFVPGRSQPRPKHHVKPHPNLAYKG